MRDLTRHATKDPAADTSLVVVADLGGSNTDLLLADAGGTVLRSAVMPAVSPSSTPAFLDALLTPLGVTPEQTRLLAVTGGRHRGLTDRIGDVPVRRVDELTAIARGGAVTSGVARALVASVGTGTALVGVDDGRVTQAPGLALGGGTLRGLGQCLLSTTDHRQIATLAAGGNPRGADLTIADIVGGDVGMLPGVMPAAYFARLASETPSRADIAAGILDMIGHLVAHMAVLTARLHGHDTVVLIGHMLEFPTVERAARRFEHALGGRFIVPPEPGLAVARGALAVATGAD